ADSTGAAPEAEAPSAEMPKSDAPTGEIKPEAAPESAPSTAAAGAPFKAKLSVVRGGRKGQEFPLEDGNNLIGRWDPETGSFPEVDLDADDPEAKISRKHALIRIDGGKITIEDIGSLNGTYVNRQPRLAPGSPAEIKSGDEVIIGKTFLKLVVEPIS
ncbi:MAG: FHA domain-containing protein, partial [Candidatus Binatus sp.]